MGAAHGWVLATGMKRSVDYTIDITALYSVLIVLNHSIRSAMPANVYRPLSWYSHLVLPPFKSM